MTLIDTHCHLNMPPLGDDPAAVLARAAARGVTRVIIPAYDLASWPKIRELLGQQNVFGALGLHPWAAAECPPGGAFDELSRQGGRAGPLGDLIHQIRTAVENNPDAKIVAIGEIGLDTKIESPGLATQLPVLEAQLQLAVDLDLPVILHCRGAFDDLLQAINKHKGKLRGVLHAFSRSAEVARQFTDAGLYIGLGGATTRPNARKVRKAVPAILLERIVLETDAPSIGLDGVLPADTEPAHVADIARAVAELRGESFETIVSATTANARALFRIP